MSSRRASSPQSFESQSASSVLGQLHEGCQFIDREYRYLYVNEAILEQIRRPTNDLVGKTMMEAFPGIETTEMFQKLQTCMEQRLSDRMDNRFVFPDGRVAWFDLRMQPIEEGMAILSIDITERKEQELSLRRALRAHATVSQCNQRLVRAVDEESFLKDFSEILVERAEYPMAWILTRGLERSTSRVYRSAASPDLEKVADILLTSSWARVLTEESTTSGVIVLSPLAEAIPDPALADLVRLHGLEACMVSPIVSDSVVLGTFVLCANESGSFDEEERRLLDEVALDLGFGITGLRTRASRIRNLAELRDSRNQARAIYDHLPHPMLVWQRHERDFQLVDLNEAAVALLSDSSVHIGAFGADLPGFPHLGEDLAECLETETHLRREVSLTFPGSEKKRHLSLTYSCLPPGMVLLHAQDITAQRRIEEQLAATQRLDAVGRLAGGVAHDFNNLLSVIMTYATFAAGELHESDPIRKDIEEIQEAGRRATVLTRQLLAFGRKQLLEPQVLDLNDAIRSIDTMLRRLAGEAIEIEYHLAEDLGRVMADAGQIGQVLMNLVVNARDAMPGGGKLTIETKNVILDADYANDTLAVAPGSYVRLSMADTGMGMEPEVKNRIFEPFFTTKGKEGGTGLGLSTVYGIVKQSGGYIWVYSEEGRGASFKIDLPQVSGATQALRPAAPQSSPRHGTETILVVEDEDAARRATVRILEAVGYSVLSAASAAEAMLLSERHTGIIDLLLTDVVMPKMSGPEMATKLLLERPDMKVLYASGYADNAIVHHGVLEPGTRFIGKPFAFASLTAKVREVLDEDLASSAKAEPGA